MAISLETIDNEINQKIWACDKCKLRNDASEPLSPLSSYKNIELMVISEKPSIEEDLIFTAYFDRHNRYLINLLGKIFPTESTHFTYLTKCYSEKKASKKEMKTCVENHLLPEYEAIYPKHCLYLGKVLADWYGKKSFGDLVVEEEEGYNVISGFWNSSYSIFSGGQKKTDEFLQFLNKLKGANAQTINLAHQ